jgi:GH25 family lysozyme M1 (1,4-beta-N-acetylmuramidase)
MKRNKYPYIWIFFSIIICSSASLAFSDEFKDNTSNSNESCYIVSNNTGLIQTDIPLKSPLDPVGDLAPTIKGIDVSHWQGNIDWPKVSQAGYKFAFIKSSEGSCLKDEKFNTNINGAHSAGILAGAYHVARPDLENSASNEATCFVNTAGNYIKPGYLRPVLDLEYGGGRLSNIALSNWITTWMDTVKSLTGVEPIIYANRDYANNYFDTSIAKYNLWIAAPYTSCDPTIPPNTGIWSGRWDFWQYCWTGKVPGITGDVDLDIFNGDQYQLSNFAIKRQNSPPSKPSTPAGKNSGYSGVEYEYTTSSIDPDGDTVKYTLDCGDTSPSLTGFVGSGVTVGIPHTWTSKGQYSVKAKATDSSGLSSEWSNPITVSITTASDNRRPNIPSIPSGPTECTSGVSYSYTTSGTDPDGDKLKYTFILGSDATITTDYVNSGTSVTVYHNWDRFNADQKICYVYAKSTDIRGKTSELSNPLEVKLINPAILPTVTNGIGATSITANSARLNGEITDTGGEHPKVTIYWGQTDGGMNANSWAYNSGEGSVGKQTFSVDISGLTPGTPYYYRCCAINSAGKTWASSTAKFATLQNLNAPTVALQAANDQFLCAEGSGGEAVVANRNAIAGWETFKLIDRGNGYYALQAANGQYLCAEGSGGGAVVANRNAIAAWETFKLIDRGNGYYALQACNGQYICAEGGGGDKVVANRNAIDAWETFRILDLRRPARVALQAYNGQYLCAEGGGGRQVVANRNAASGWETFKLIDRGNGNVALQAYNGQYLCAEGGGGQQVVANRNAIDAWETFRLIYRGDGNVALQAFRGQYLCAEGGGGDGVVADRDWIGGWETFRLIPA